MKRIIQLTAIALLFLAAACSDSKKDNNATITDKKTKLEKLKITKTQTDAEIEKLQEELNKLDTTSANNSKVKLVGVAPVTAQSFQHFIDLRGKIDAENISYISPRSQPTQVKAVYVQQGQAVKKGQLLLKLDDAIMRQSVIAAKQQLEGIKTQLGYAKNIYQRQQNLSRKYPTIREIKQNGGKESKS